MWLAIAMVAGSCTAGGSTPATAPPTTLRSETVPTTGGVPSSTVSTSSSTSTTLDRLAEVQAIFEDLERRRLQALYDGDREAFADLFANDAYLEISMGAFDDFTLDSPPEVSVRVLRLLVDRDDCLVFEHAVTIDGLSSGLQTDVLERRTDRTWGYSYSGKGWLCDGPHPLG